MNNYEKSIGLKTIYLTIIRRWKIILFLFIPIALVSFVVTNFFMTKTYQSSVTVSKDTAFSATHFDKFKTALKSSDLATTVADALKEDGTKHSNGNEITASEILSGLSFTTPATTAVSATFSFQSTDNTITQPVLAKFADSAVESIKAVSEFKGIKVTSTASAAVKNSSERKYLIIGIAAGAVVALGGAFIYEIISDEVYDKGDVEMLGCPAFELKVNKK